MTVPTLDRASIFGKVRYLGGPVALLVTILAANISTGGCSSSSGKSVDAASDGGGGGDSTVNGDAGSIVAARPYNFKVPTGYDRNNATPLVIMLHGYSASGVVHESYFQFGAVADEQTFLYAYPDGTFDPLNNRFWNADDACCDFFASAIDDVAYVNAMIDDISTKYNVDPKRIFVVGHSNGAFHVAPPGMRPVGPHRGNREPRRRRVERRFEVQPVESRLGARRARRRRYGDQLQWRSSRCGCARCGGPPGYATSVPFGSADDVDLGGEKWLYRRADPERADPRSRHDAPRSRDE
jgi:Esterase PHB depolymerase